MKDEGKQLMEQADFMLKILNHQRHDWLNHVQVLMSYLKMGRSEEGLEYLTRITEKICQESMIAHINCPLLSTFFLTFPAIHRDLPLEWEVCGQTDVSRLQMNRQEFSEILMQLVHAIQEYRLDPVAEAGSLLVSLSGDEQQVEVRMDLSGSLTASGIEEVGRLIERSVQQAATVREWSISEDECVLAMSFPCRR